MYVLTNVVLGGRGGEALFLDHGHLRRAIKLNGFSTSKTRYVLQKAVRILLVQISNSRGGGGGEWPPSSQRPGIQVEMYYKCNYNKIAPSIERSPLQSIPALRVCPGIRDSK